MLKMVDGTGIIGVDMVCPLGGAVSPPQPPNYDNVEMEGAGSLMLPNSLKAPLERLELIGNSMQGENPAPDNPQEIKSVGRKSRNLFDVTKLKKGVDTNYPTEIELVGETLIAKKDGGTSNQMLFEIELANLEPNTTYEFTTNQIICKRKDLDTESAGRIFVFRAYKNESQIENKGNVFTTSESKSDIYKIVFGIIAGDFGSLEYVKIEQPMLSHSGGSYEPYSDKYFLDVKITGKKLLSNKPTDWMIGKTTPWGAVPQTPVSYGKNVKNAIATINVKSSTNYSFINKDTNKLWVCRIIELDANGLGLVNHALYANESFNYKKYSFSTRSNTANIVFEIKRVDNTELLSTDIESIKIMLVEGDIDESTPYEPYTEQTVQIALDEPLRGIGDYKDVLTKDGVVRRIKRIVFDGSEDEKWGIGIERENVIDFVSTQFSDATKINEHQRSMMDKLKWSSGVWGRDEIGQDMFARILRINMPKTLAPDLQTFKTWLSQNPLIVDYVLAEPVTEPLPESVQAQLSSLNSENGTTHINIDSGEVLCGIKLTYRKEK